MSPREMEDKVETYAFYMTMGVIALFVVIMLILILIFVVNVLCVISIGG